MSVQGYVARPLHLSVFRFAHDRRLCRAVNVQRYNVVNLIAPLPAVLAPPVVAIARTDSLVRSHNGPRQYWRWYLDRGLLDIRQLYHYHSAAL